MSKKLSKSLSNETNWHFNSFFALKTPETLLFPIISEILWWFFWRNNCRLLYDVVKNLSYSDQKINQIENLIIYFNFNFNQKSNLIKLDPSWSILDISISIWSENIQSWKSHDIFQWLFPQISNLIKFDPLWFILDKSDSIWSKNK